MKKLSEILPQKVGYEIKGQRDIEVKELFMDSRQVQEGGLFAAVRGTQVDGHQFIEKAIEKGARSFLVESLPEDYNADLTWVVVPDVRIALAEMADMFFDKPSSHINVIGITGTNGKTSIAWFIYQAINALHQKCGLISTIDVRYGDEVEKATLTTPDVISIHRTLKKMVDARCEYVVMEASSHALDQGRLNEVRFDVAIFSNISRDHLDYHGDMLSYIKCKKMLFDHLSQKAIALYNKDDRNGEVMVQSTQAHIKSYSLRQIADYRLKLCSMDLNGMELEWDGKRFFSRVTGRFNTQNIAAVLGCLMELDFEADEVLTVLSSMTAPEGRLELISGPSGRVEAIVDYAHTPDALVNVLKTVNELKSPSQQLILVVGAGGNRDKGKRPIMGKSAVLGANLVIFTADNPRNENADDIIHDMLDGLEEHQRDDVIVIPNRREAIKMAVRLKKKEDVVLIVGKGHEKYQEINGEKIPFDDKVEVYNYLYKEI